MKIQIDIQALGLESAINNLANALKGSSKTIEVEVPKTVEEDLPNEVEEDVKQKVQEVQEEPKEEKTSSGLKFEDVRVKLAEISQQGKQKEIKALVKSFGVDKLSDIPEEKYSELLEKAEAL